MNFRSFFVAGLLVYTAFLTGCGITKAREEAAKVLTKHFTAISTNGFDAAMDDYDSSFFQKTSREEWKRVLTEHNPKLGNYQSYSILSWRASTTVGDFESGTTVDLDCTVTYSKHLTHERFILFKSVGGREYKIRKHRIDATSILSSEK